MKKNRPSHTKRRWLKKINRQKEFEKIDSYDSSDDFIGYSGSSETESYPNIKERNLSEKKKEITNKINSLSTKQTETKNKDSREY